MSVYDSAEEGMEAWRAHLASGDSWVLPQADAELSAWSESDSQGAGWYSTSAGDDTAQIVYVHAGRAVAAATFHSDDPEKGGWKIRNFVLCGEEAEAAGMRQLQPTIEEPKD